MRLLAKDRPVSICIDAHSGGSEPATEAQRAQTTVIDRPRLAISQELTRHGLVIKAKQETVTGHRKATGHQKACSSQETRCGDEALSYIQPVDCLHTANRPQPS